MLRITRRHAHLAAMVAVPAWMNAYGLRYTRNVYEAPAFAVAKEMLGLEWWAVLWAVVGLAATVAAVFRWGWAWSAAAIGSVSLAAVWTGSLLWARYVTDATVSYTGLGLWVFYVFGVIGLATSPYQFERRT